MREYEEEVADYLIRLVKVRSYSDKTSVSYAHDLEILGDFLKENGIFYLDFDADAAKNFAMSLYEKQYSYSSVNRIISGCRSFYAHLARLHLIEKDPFERIKRAKQKTKIPTVLARQEVLALLDFESTDYTSLMEKTMFNIFYSTGCRLSEVLGMKTTDVDFSMHRILVTGKGSKQRFVFLTPKAENILKIYLTERQKAVANCKDGDCGILLINKKGRMLPSSTVHCIFDKYSEKLNLDKKFTPHTFRHTFATHMLDNKADIRVVQALLGHEHIGTTQIYTHVSTAGLEDIYSKSHPHGKRSRK